MKKINLFAVALSLLAMSTCFGTGALAQVYGPNLVVNGDFSDNNEGTFTTDYLYVNPANVGSTSLHPEGVYTIASDASLYHNNFEGTAYSSPNFLIVNGHTKKNHATTRSSG
jgi:hypothetical protein